MSPEALEQKLQSARSSFVVFWASTVPPNKSYMVNTELLKSAVTNEELRERIHSLIKNSAAIGPH